MQRPLWWVRISEQENLSGQKHLRHSIAHQLCQRGILRGREAPGGIGIQPQRQTVAVIMSKQLLDLQPNLVVEYYSR